MSDPLDLGLDDGCSSRLWKVHPRGYALFGRHGEFIPGFRSIVVILSDEFADLCFEICWQFVFICFPGDCVSPALLPVGFFHNELAVFRPLDTVAWLQHCVGHMGYRALFEGRISHLFTVLVSQLFPAAELFVLPPAFQLCFLFELCEEGGVKLTHSAFSDLLLERK